VSTVDILIRKLPNPLAFVKQGYDQIATTYHVQRNLKNKRIICLDIPDGYSYMDPELIDLLQNKISSFLPRS